MSTFGIYSPGSVIAKVLSVGLGGQAETPAMMLPSLQVVAGRVAEAGCFVPASMPTRKFDMLKRVVVALIPGQWYFQ